jgi:hypothetical protein
MYKAIILGDVSGIVPISKLFHTRFTELHLLYSSNGNNVMSKTGSELLYLKSHPGYPSRF